MTDQSHFHIRWLPSGALDWQRFGTETEAQTRAKELLLPGESYEIEVVTGNCEMCAALDPRNASPGKLRKRAAS